MSLKCASASSALNFHDTFQTIYDLDVALQTSQESIRKIKNEKGDESKKIQTIQKNIQIISRIIKQYKGIDDWPAKVLKMVKSYGEEHLSPDKYIQIFI